MRIHKKFAAVLLCGLLGLACAACEKSQAGNVQPVEPEVTVLTVAPRQVKLVTALPGRTSAHLVSEVRPQVGGIIKSRLFTEGTDVKQGEVLYQIDPAPFQAAYDSAKAALVRAEANAQPSRLKAERYANILRTNGVSRQDNDDAQAAYKQSLAEVVAAKAALETARINLGYTKVVAPISGRIGKSTVTPGALVTASQATPMATVQQIDPIYVDVTKASAEVLRLQRDFASGRLKNSAANGARVRLLLEDGTPYPEEGVLQFSDITVDQSTGVVTLRALFPNPGHMLLPGLYVRAILEEGMDENAILVPQAAVVRDSKGNPQVMLVRGDGLVELRPIVTDRVIGDDWLVSEGLAAGDRIIVEGLQKARAGAKVKVVEAARPQTPAAAAQQTPPAGKPETAPAAARS